MAFNLKTILWCLCFLFTYWLIYSFYKKKPCANNQNESQALANRSDIILNQPIKKVYKPSFKKNRNLSIIFIVGLKGSGLSLMKDLLNEASEIECKENNFISEFILSSLRWTKTQTEQVRLRHASISDELIESASSQFILELIGKTQGHYSCLKEIRLLDKVSYLKKLFPNMKMILMIRDPRAFVGELNYSSFNFGKPKQAQIMYKNKISKWNEQTKKAYEDCELLDCYKVYYEQLTLDSQNTMKKVLNYLNIDFNDYEIKKVKIEKDKVLDWLENVRIDDYFKFSRNATMIKKLGYVISNQVPTFESYNNLLNK